MRETDSPVRNAGPSVLIVSSDAVTVLAANAWRKNSEVRLVIVKTIAEAEELLRDLRFIGARLDALIVEYTLPDGCGCRFIGGQRDDFPDAAMALVSELKTSSLQMWSRVFQTTLLLKPLATEDFHRVLLHPAGDPLRLGVGMELDLELAHA